MRNISTVLRLQALKFRFLIALFSIAIIVSSQPLSPGSGWLGAIAPNDLEKKIAELVKASGAEAVAVAYYDLATGRELLINPDVNFHAASTMKVPVMMELYRNAAAGKLSLNQRISIKNSPASSTAVIIH